MKFVLFALLLPMLATSFTQESPPLEPQRISPEQIEQILDFESIDEELKEYLRKRIRRIDPRKDEAEKRVMIASAAPRKQ